MKNPIQTTFKYGVLGVASMAILASAAAEAAWKPSKQLEILTHVRTTSSTYRFAKAVEKAAKPMLKKGVKVLSIRGARGDRARRHLSIKNKANNHMMQVITPSQVNNPILAKQKTRPWHFTPLALMVVSPNLMTVNANSPYKTMKDVMDKACANPGKVIHGGGDFGNVASLNSILLQRKIKCKWTYTPFDDQGILKLLGGHIDFVMENPGQLLQFVRAGKMRIIAASEKLGEFPKVPTYQEAGYGFPVLKQYRGLWMGKDVSKAAVKYWMGIIEKVRKDSSFKKYVKKNNLTPVFIKRNELAKMLKTEFDNYLALGTELNLIGKKKKKKKKKKEKKSS
ncbi:MAG: tripartite tricarboxylate transporter substrate-binding protein [Rhodospirillales bacterium]